MILEENKITYIRKIDIRVRLDTCYHITESDLNIEYNNNISLIDILYWFREYSRFFDIIKDI